jgi:hypothetical protein
VPAYPRKGHTSTGAYQHWLLLGTGLAEVSYTNPSSRLTITMIMDRMTDMPADTLDR